MHSASLTITCRIHVEVRGLQAASLLQSLSSHTSRHQNLCFCLLSDGELFGGSWGRFPEKALRIAPSADSEITNDGTVVFRGTRLVDGVAAALLVAPPNGPTESVQTALAPQLLPECPFRFCHEMKSWYFECRLAVLEQHKGGAVSICAVDTRFSQPSRVYLSQGGDLNNFTAIMDFANGEESCLPLTKLTTVARKLRFPMDRAAHHLMSSAKVAERSNTSTPSVSTLLCFSLYGTNTRKGFEYDSWRHRLPKDVLEQLTTNARYCDRPTALFDILEVRLEDYDASSNDGGIDWQRKLSPSSLRRRARWASASRSRGTSMSSPSCMDGEMSDPTSSLSGIYEPLVHIKPLEVDPSETDAGLRSSVTAEWWTATIDTARCAGKIPVFLVRSRLWDVRDSSPDDDVNAHVRVPILPEMVEGHTNGTFVIPLTLPRRQIRRKAASDATCGDETTEEHVSTFVTSMFVQYVDVMPFSHRLNDYRCVRSLEGLDHLTLDTMVGHRGLGKTYTSDNSATMQQKLAENSLESLNAAHARGCQCVEFDVMLTKDFLPIIFHDAILQVDARGKHVVKNHHHHHHHHSRRRGASQSQRGHSSSSRHTATAAGSSSSVASPTITTATYDALPVAVHQLTYRQLNGAVTKAYQEVRVNRLRELMVKHWIEILDLAHATPLVKHRGVSSFGFTPASAAEDSSCPPPEPQHAQGASTFLGVTSSDINPPRHHHHHRVNGKHQKQDQNGEDRDDVGHDASSSSVVTTPTCSPASRPAAVHDGNRSEATVLPPSCNAAHHSDPCSTDPGGATALGTAASHAKKPRQRLPAASSSTSRFVAASSLHRVITNHIPTLQELFDQTPSTLRLDLEVKYPFQPLADSHLYLQEDHFEINDFVNAILDVVFRNIERQPDREIVFCSFDPDVCISLMLKQCRFHVLFLSDTEEHQDLKDYRSWELEVAIQVASGHHFAGISICAMSLMSDDDKKLIPPVADLKNWTLQVGKLAGPRVPSLTDATMLTDQLLAERWATLSANHGTHVVRCAHRHHLKVWSWGDRNSDPHFAFLQAQEMHLDAVISDNVPLWSNASVGRQQAHQRHSSSRRSTAGSASSAATHSQASSDHLSDASYVSGPDGWCSPTEEVSPQRQRRCTT